MTTYSLAQKLRTVFIILSVFCLVAAIIFLRQLTVKNNESAMEKPVYTKEAEHRVLLLSSYNPLYFTYQYHIEGIEESLTAHNIEFDVVFMDAKIYNQPEDIIDFHEFLKKRLATYDKYDGLLVADDEALEFAIHYQDELFKDIPIVFFCVNNLKLAKQAVEVHNITGFYENDNLREVLGEALNMLPSYKEVYAIHDNTAAGSSDARVFKEIAGRYPQHKFKLINTAEMTEDQYIKALSKIPDDAIVFYLTCFTNGDGYTYSIYEMTDIVTTYTNAPIFRNVRSEYADGVMCSFGMDFKAQAKAASDVMVDAICGTDVDLIPLNTETEYVMQFDYQCLRRCGVDVKNVPSNSSVFNTPVNILERYGDFLPVAGMTFLSLLFMILAVTAVAVNEKNINTELLESKKQLEKSQVKLKYQAEHDDFLDILNRRTAVDYLKENVTAEQQYSILMLDIDNFKDINEMYGHKLADEFLQIMTYELQKLASNKNWMIARYGGDEFLLHVPVEMLNAESETVRKILDIFRTPRNIENENVVTSCSIGISISDGITRPELHIINAEIAMYEAKMRGRNKAYVYSEEMKSKVMEENHIKAKLLDAMDNNGFYMLYQPQIDAKTKKISGYEALVRMNAEGMYPGVFIPIAESSGWISRIGRITTELVVKQLAAWRDAGYELYPVSINFSSNQIHDFGYVEYLRELLYYYKIPSQYLEIEVTEGLFLERTQQAEKLFESFKELGIKLLMDDFGTGYSSLGYLTYIPVDVVKLDKSLVDAYLVPEKDAFIRDVIQLVHDLDKVIIIEGVEENWQYERLREFNADIIQGYYFSKPIDSDAAIKFSAENK
ncbi:MAG: EAL domain-containing protein [Butyrivibrio sp.]|nr:EAL domain-containing protein [Butyrivibrio sp.]